MSQRGPAILVCNVSKAYRTGSARDPSATVAGALVRFFARPLQNVRRLHTMTEFTRAHPPPPGDSAHQGSMFWALRDVTFSIQPGEAVGIIGPNGAGKSTLLKILARITSPLTGFAEIRGRVGSLLEVGTGFHPELTGRENIFLNAAILGMRRSEVLNRFDAIVAFSELEAFLDTPVKRYSSGMRVRLAFAIAAHLEPEVLLLDEVLAVGDAAFQDRCIGRVHELVGGGRTVLFVSHNMQAVASLCRRVIVLRDGCVHCDSDAATAIRAYLSTVATTGSEAVWTDASAAPGDAQLKLQAVRVTNSNGATSGLYTSSEPIRVQFTFHLFAADRALHIGFDLDTLDGVRLMRCYHNDTLQGCSIPLEPGVHTLTCTIPPNLLNAGTFLLSPRIGIHMLRWIVNSPPVVRFTVEFTHGATPFLNNPERRKHGLILPPLLWEGV